MTPSTTRVADATAASAAGGDERLAYRGVFARILVRPEIGAAIAAVSIWIFFWAVSVPFGLTSGAASILDVSATLGIMAVAVSMLMIGGEFDLSAGAATGAFGIITLLLVRDVTGEMGGAGLSLWFALPLSFLLAMGLGLFNGTLVNKTSLPSFIVTLASFFILVGSKLGFAKLLVDQIQVGKMNDLAIFSEDRASDKGYAFFNRIFAAEWERNLHQWDSRDAFYTFGVVAGLTLLVIALYELRFRRKETQNMLGLGVCLAGIVLGLVGIFNLHNTRGTQGDVVGAGFIGFGILVGFIGLAMWRYESLNDRGGLTLTADASRPLILGLVALAASFIAARYFDSQNSEDIFFMVTEQGLRAILFVGLGATAAVFLLISSSRAGYTSQTARSAVLMLTALLVAATAFFIRAESVTPKFRTQVLAVMLVLAALMATWAVTTLLFAERRSPDDKAERLGRTLVIVGSSLAVMGVVARMLFVVQAEIDAGAPPSKFSVRILWFLGFTAACAWVLARTKFGSWTFAVGGNKQASRQIGVPAERTKTQLFMLVAGAAWLVGTLLAFRLNTIQASTGDGLEFEFIIAAVVGGTMLTGGYGSAIGAAIGAIIMAMAKQGIPSSRWNSDWRFVFLGVILLLAVIANDFIRSKAEAAR